MSEQTPPEQPAQPEAAPGDRWGDDISEERWDELKALADRQREWAATPEGERGKSVFKEVPLTGADVFWLAAYALAGPDGDVAGAQERLRAVGEDVDEEDEFDLNLLHVEGADLSEEHLERADLKNAHLEDALLWPAGGRQGAGARAVVLRPDSLLLFTYSINQGYNAKFAGNGGI